MVANVILLQGSRLKQEIVEGKTGNAYIDFLEPKISIFFFFFFPGLVYEWERCIGTTGKDIRVNEKETAVVIL